MRMRQLYFRACAGLWLQVALMFTYLVHGMPGYASIVFVGLLSTLDPLQVRHLTAIRHAMTATGYYTTESIWNEWIFGTLQARFIGSLAYFSVAIALPCELSPQLILNAFMVAVCVFGFDLPAATEAELLFRLEVNLKDYYSYEMVLQCIQSCRLVDSVATLGAVTAAAVAHRSLENGGDNAAEMVQATAAIWILLAPMLSWYDCGWWIEWRKISGYILFFSFVMGFLSILDLDSTEVRSCEADSRSVRCLFSAVSSCPWALTQVVFLALGSFSPFPALFLDERMHARVTELTEALKTGTPDSFIEQIAHVDRRDSTLSYGSERVATTISRARTWGALSVSRVFG